MIKSRILVVDDEPNLSGLVRLFLEKTQRFEVRVENRSSLALAVAREFRPALIVLDVDMPGKDGGEVARQMSQDPALRDVPILFLTSLISRSEAGGGVAIRGGMPFLAKPPSAQVLIQTVDRLLMLEPHAA